MLRRVVFIFLSGELAKIFSIKFSNLLVFCEYDMVINRLGANLACALNSKLPLNVGILCLQFALLAGIGKYSLNPATWIRRASKNG